MSSPTSPWSDSAECISPDGLYRAIIYQASEVGMGAPTSGTLVICENRQSGQVLSRHMFCSPSFVWSSDSRAIAAPQWTQNREQRLVVISVPSGQVSAAPGEFSVLELHSFDDGVVRGVDSPVYMPKRVERHVGLLIHRDETRAA
jgi:hypothetical protein